MSKTRIPVETHESGNWLATLDMDLGKGQRLTFSSFLPVDPAMQVNGVQALLVQQAAELLLQMQNDLNSKG